MFTNAELIDLQRCVAITLERVERDNNNNYQKFSNPKEHERLNSLRLKLYKMLRKNDVSWM